MLRYCVNGGIRRSFRYVHLHLRSVPVVLYRERSSSDMIKFLSAQAIIPECPKIQLKCAKALNSSFTLSRCPTSWNICSLSQKKKASEWWRFLITTTIFRWGMWRTLNIVSVLLRCLSHLYIVRSFFCNIFGLFFTCFIWVYVSAVYNNSW